MNDAEWARCVHEAGHVVLATKYGLEVRYASIEKTPGCVFEHGNDPFRAAQVYGAGEMAELLVRKKVVLADYADDMEEISILSDGVRVPDRRLWCLQASLESAKALLGHEGEIETVANELMDKSTLHAEHFAKHHMPNPESRNL